jgi:hypothetical protein
MRREDTFNESSENLVSRKGAKAAKKTLPVSDLVMSGDGPRAETTSLACAFAKG